MTKRQLEKVRAKFENFDLSRYHILTYDGTEVTITQGDIDWAQDYCDAHGIGWSKSGEEEAKANDDAKDSTQSPTAENQAEPENYDFPDETNDNYSTEKAEELKAEEENLQAASNEKENASVSAESNKASRNESKENVFTHIEKSIGDFYGKVKNGITGMMKTVSQAISLEKTYVVNKTDVTILIKPEMSTKPYALVKSGESYKGKIELNILDSGIDGVIFPDGTVVKTSGKVKCTATTDKDGNYVLKGGEIIDVAVNELKKALNKNISSWREEDEYRTYSYNKDGSAPFLDDWLNSSKKLDIDNDHTFDIENFVPIPRNLDGTVPSATDTLSRWNEFLK